MHYWKWDRRRTLFAHYCGEKFTWHTKATQRPVLVFRPQTEFLNKTKVHFRRLVPTRQHQILVSTPVGWIKPTSTHLRCGHILQISLELDEKSAWGKCFNLTWFLLKERFTQKWKFAHPQVVPNLSELFFFWTQDILNTGDSQTVDGSIYFFSYYESQCINATHFQFLVNLGSY